MGGFRKDSSWLVLDNKTQALEYVEQGGAKAGLGD